VIIVTFFTSVRLWTHFSSMRTYPLS
jgi:hypothetical protein